MIMIEHLPIDLFTEILCRLPVKSLIVFKCVSKTWNKHISHVCLPKISPDVSILFLYCGGVRKHIDSFYYTECGLSYPPFPIETNENYLELDSCNGLVLFKTYKTFSHVIDSRYIVANATTKQCFVIPEPLGYDRGNDAVLAFDPFQSSHYKIILPRHVSKSMSSVVEIFSSETGKWVRHILPIKLPTASRATLIKKTICLDGALYMLSTRKCLIRLNLKSVTAEAIEVPCWDGARKRGLIAVSNGSLCYTNFDKEFRLLIWQFDYYSTTDSSWTLKHRICLHDLMDKHLMASWHRRMKRYPRESHLSAFEPFGIHPSSNVIYLGMHRMRIFSYHLEKRELNFLWESEHQSFGWRENYVHPYSCSHIMANDFSKIERKASKLESKVRDMGLEEVSGDVEQIQVQRRRCSHVEERRGQDGVVAVCLTKV